MPVTAGDVRATLTLDTSEFSAGVARAQSELSTLTAGGEKVTNAFEQVESRLNTSASAIAQAMSAAGNGSVRLNDLAARADQAGAKAELLARRTAEAAQTMLETRAAAQASADALALLQESADASAENVEWARQRLEELGESSETTAGQLQKARAELEEFEAESADLRAQVEQLRSANEKNAAASKRAEDRYDNLKLQLSGAENAAERANTKFGALAQTLSGSGKGMSLKGLIDDISALGSSTLTSASRSLGTIAVNAAGIGSTTATGAIASEGLGQALSSMIRLAGPVNLALVGVGGALAYGAYQLYDYESGAKAAREALADLSETAGNWQDTDATTSFEKSEGIKAFGLSDSDFSGMVQNSRLTVDEIVRVWQDGKVETDEIVAGMVGAWTSETDTVREGVEKIKETASAGGYVPDSFLAGLDEDLARLDEIDAQVEALLKKKQNGFLSDEDTALLNELQGERRSLSIKYNLEPGENGGFEQIVTGVEAALARGADPAQVYADSFAAATQGVSEYTEALNAEYDAQYAVIQLMEEGPEKAAAMDQLDTWYNEQSTSAINAYNDALAKSLELTDAFGDGGSLTKTGEQLTNVYELMKKVAENPGDNTATKELADALSDLDETQVTEVTSAIVAMQAAAQQAGTELPEQVRPIADAIQNIKTTLGTDVFEGSLGESLQNMFGQNLDSEVLQVYAALDANSLETSYTAWAQGQHTDIIPSLNKETIDLSLGELEGTVTALHEGETVTVDLATLDALNGTVAVIDDAGTATTVNLSSLSGLTGTVSAYNEDGEVTFSAGALKQLTGDVTTIVISENAEIPKVQLEGEVRQVNLSEGEFTNSSNPEIEYAQGSGAVDKSTPLRVPSDTAARLEDLATAITKYNAAVESGDTEAKNAWLESITTISGMLGTSLDAQNGKGFEELAQYVANGLQLLKDGALTEEEAALFTTTLANLQTALGSEIAMNASMTDTGSDIAAGLAEGLTAYGWSTDATTVAGSLQTAIDTAVGRGSPAELTKPTGSDVSAGLGEGMKGYDFSADASTVASAAGGALSAAFAGVDASGAGQALMDSTVSGLDGLEDDFSSTGDNAGSAFVSELRGHISAAASAATAIGSAAYNALKASLDIHSPSRKMRKLGAYTGEGYALGISDEIAASEASIRRLAGATLKAAARPAGNSYSNSININLNHATLRSEEDIRKLSRQLGDAIRDANYGLS